MLIAVKKNINVHLFHFMFQFMTVAGWKACPPSLARIHQGFALLLSAFSHHGEEMTRPGGHTCPPGRV